MPADLTNPFGESCCDGGACSDLPHVSAQSCGCDPGAGWLCANHKFREGAYFLMQQWRERGSDEALQCANELEDLLG